MNKILTEKDGGFPLVMDDFRWFLGQNTGTTSSQAGIYNILTSTLTGLTGSQNFIIEGCNVFGASAITEGWVVLDGEILKVDKCTYVPSTSNYFHKVLAYDAEGVKYFQDGTTGNTWEANRAVLSLTSSSHSFMSGNTLHADIVAAQFGTVQVMNYSDITELTATTGTKVIDQSGFYTLVGENLKKKVLNIGAWDMTAATGVVVAHGITDGLTKIKSVNVVLYEDTGTYGVDIFGTAGGLVGGSFRYGNTNIELFRENSGRFDNNAFDNAIMNRGLITIWYSI